MQMLEVLLLCGNDDDFTQEGTVPFPTQLAFNLGVAVSQRDRFLFVFSTQTKAASPNKATVSTLERLATYFNPRASAQIRFPCSFPPSLFFSSTPPSFSVWIFFFPLLLQLSCWQMSFHPIRFPNEIYENYLQW